MRCLAAEPQFDCGSMPAPQKQQSGGQLRQQRYPADGMRTYRAPLVTTFYDGNTMVQSGWGAGGRYHLKCKKVGEVDMALSDLNEHEFRRQESVVMQP